MGFRDGDGDGDGDGDWEQDLGAGRNKSEQRYSGKPDGDSRNAQGKVNKTTRQQDHK